MRMRVQPAEVSMGAAGATLLASVGEVPRSIRRRAPKIERGGVIIVRGRSGREINMDMITYSRHEE